MLGLAERSLSSRVDPSLTQDLATWWSLAGDSARAATLLQGTLDSVPAEERSELQRRAGEWYARAGRETHAQAAFRRACQEPNASVEAWESLGKQGFWAQMDPAEASDAFLHAAERRRQRGEDQLELENQLRAFELSPDSLKAAEALANSLVRRGRAGAAEEVLRSHLRLGPAAQRVAHHQRRFSRALGARDWGAALSAAVEAELDVELDPERVKELLEGQTVGSPTDFESFLLGLASEDRLGTPHSFGIWLAALLELHVSDWGEAAVEAIFQGVRRRFRIAPVPRLSPPEAEARARELRRSLGVEHDPVKMRELREQLALAQARLGRFTDALDALEPILLTAAPSLEFAAFALFVAGRARDSIGRARSVFLVAQMLPQRASAELGAVAAELLLGEGLLSEARAAAQWAVSADSTCERAVAAQALVVLRAPDGADGGQLETSLSVLVARSETCGVLARAAERRGTPRLALNWVERTVSLRPCDIQALREYLELAVRAEDAERLADGIRTVLTDPVPLGPLTAQLTEALLTLGTLDAERTAQLLPLVLETASRFEECRRVVFRLASDLGLPEARALYFERELVSAPSSSRGELLLELASARAEAGQLAAAARAARRALTREIHPRAVRELVSSWPRVSEPDGQLALLEAEVEFVRSLGDEESGLDLGALLVSLGAARWDMAEDPKGAMDAWLAAADLDADEGLFKLAQTLVLVAGAEQAARELESVSRETEDPTRSGRLLGLASRAWLDVPSKPEAFRTAALAVERAPLLTEFLTVLEEAADKSQTEELGRIYVTLAEAALGCFGERAVRYRAARQLEARGALDEAFEQAKLAFLCVPAEGVSFVLMVRLSDRLGRSIEVVELLERVAESAVTPVEKERWEQRAAALADPAAIGLRQRVDILLRAAGVRPEEATLRALIDALAELFSLHPAARVELRERFKGVCEETILLATGSHGAVLAVLLAEAALVHFGELAIAFECLRRAVSTDLDLEQYESITPHAAALVLDAETAGAWVEQVRRRAEQEGAPLGGALAELTGKVAELLGNVELQAELFVRAAEDHPSDATLVARARLYAERAERRDLLEIVEDLMPVSERARSLLARIQNMTIEESLDAVLEMDLGAAPLDLRVQLLEILADRLERVGRLADARDSYLELIELIPDHDQALRGLERVADRDQDYEELARVLKLRAEVAADPEDARRIRLRRAVVLETQLGRAVEARAVLEDLLGRSGDSWAVLRVLADSWERAGDPANAAELWLRARRVAPDPESVADVTFRAARAYFEAGEAKRSREALSQLTGTGHGGVGQSAEELELRLLVERALGDSRAILDALVALAQVKRDEPQRVAEWFAEAVELALQLGELGIAEKAADDALGTGIDSPVCRLWLAQLRARREGVPDVPAAERLLEDLRGTQALRAPKQREVRAYLFAWAKEILEGPTAGLRELEAGLAELGTVPLLSVALAERLVQDPERALAFYESAVGGDFLRMKRPGDVLLAAGALARSLGHLDRAQALVSAVRDDDPRRPDAARELEGIALERTRTERQAREARAAAERHARDELAAADAREAEHALEERRRAAERELEEKRAAERLAAEHAEQQRAEHARLEEEAEQQRVAEARAREAELAERERLEKARVERADEEQRARVRAEEEAQLRAEIARQAREAEAEARAEATREAREERVSRRPPPLPESSRAEPPPLPDSLKKPSSFRGPLDLDEPGTLESQRRLDSQSRLESQSRLDAQSRLESQSRLDAQPDAMGRAHRPPPLPVGFVAEETNDVNWRGRGESTEPPPPSSSRRSEELLVQALEAGDVASGRELLEALLVDRSRSRDAVVVASHLVLLEPGNAEALGRLVTTALRDGNEAFALAVRHVMGAFGVGQPVVAPPLEELSEQPDAVRAVVGKGIRQGASEALGLVWEHAPGLFKKEIGAYGLSGVERIPTTAQTPLGVIYRNASRILGAGRTGLYRGPAADEISLAVALTVPPAVIVSGRVEEPNAEFAFHFGAMLAAAQPEHVLLYGQAASRTQEILSALHLSFGSGGAPATIPSAEVTRISSFLWQTIPPRAQRRLTQICSEPGAISLAAVSDASRRMLRRAGLVVSGDISVAVADACAEAGIESPSTLAELEVVCRQNSRVLDLVQFALSAEYAEVRFRTPALHSTGFAMRR